MMRFMQNTDFFYKLMKYLIGMKTRQVIKQKQMTGK